MEEQDFEDREDDGPDMSLEESARYSPEERREQARRSGRIAGGYPCDRS